MKISFNSFRNLFRVTLVVLLSAFSGTTFGDDEKQEKESQEKSEKILAIVGGDIHTVTGPVIRQGTVLIQDGKISELGQSVDIPEGATVIDAKGKIITPGFIAINMRGVGIRTAPSGSNKLGDSLDPFDRNIKYSLGVGITTGCVELSGGRGRGRRRRSGEPEELHPGLDRPEQEYVTEAMLDYGDLDTALCPCCGLPVLPTEPIVPTRPTQAKPKKMAVVKMGFGNLDTMMVKDNVFYSPAPGALTSALQRHNWRRDLGIAKKAIEEKKKADANKSKAEPARKPVASAENSKSQKPTPSKATSRNAKSKKPTAKPELIALLKRETAMRVQANTVDEINDMVDLAEEFGYDLVIEGGIEAWVLAEKLGVSSVSVIYTPRQRREPRPGQEETTGSSIESPRIFQDSGIPFATSTLSNSISMGGLAGRDLTSLPLEAAFAVRGGATEKSALESLTIAPARMLGVDDRIGSIEKGKDADLLILNGAPLDYRTYVEQAIVAGNVCYDREKDRVFPVFDPQK